MTPWTAAYQAPPSMGFSRQEYWSGVPLPTTRDRLPTPVFLGFPSGSAGKESACNTGDLGSIPGLGRAPGEGNGNPLQCSCLENPMDRGAWQATVYGVTSARHDLATKPPPLKWMHETGCSGLVHWDDPEGWNGEGGGRGVQDGEHM